MKRLYSLRLIVPLLILGLSHCGPLTSGHVQVASNIASTDQDSGTIEDPSLGESADTSIIDPGVGSGDPITDTVQVLNVVTSNLENIMPYALKGGFYALRTPELTADEADILLSYQRRDCLESGKIAFSGFRNNTSDTEAFVTLEIQFDACDGLNGNITSEITYKLGFNTTTYSIYTEGLVGGEGCVVELDAFQHIISQDPVFGTSTYSYMTPIQNVLAECSEQTTTCSFPEATGVNDAVESCFAD